MMINGPKNDCENACPFINYGDSRCAARFSLCQIEQAYLFCLSSYTACSTFYQLATELKTVDPHTFDITIKGRTLEAYHRYNQAGVALRRTGS